MCQKSAVWRNPYNEWKALSSDDHQDARAMVKGEIVKGGSTRLQTLVQTPHPKFDSAITHRLYQARRGWQAKERKRRLTPTEAEEQSESAADDNEHSDLPSVGDSGDRRNIMAIGSLIEPSTQP